jgi:4-amino-4-deoxy-L-arabinose transferase-like glycosyltransferase
LDFYKKTVLLIAGSTLLRMTIAGFLELGNDEVYYQTYAQHLQWSYFDHPPMVAWMIRMTTFNLQGDSEFFIRLGSVLFAAAGTWLIFKIGMRVKNEYAGFIAAILYTTSFYTSVISGIFVLPDSPQVFFWLLGIYCMIRVLDSDSSVSKQSFYWMLLGITTGLCIMSKVHGIFLCLGFGAYIVFYRKDLLKSRGFWISCLIAAIVISPIFFWNFSNHFITYTYHRGRFGFLGNRPDPDRLIQQVLGSVFYSNPVNFIIYVLAVWAFWKHYYYGSAFL